MIPLGIVVIGRNEGERLGLALRAVQTNAPAGAEIVYVDSDSVDGSVASARAHHAQVVQLDTTSPLSAARARNAGFEWLLKRNPTIRFVQFIDGDCELQPGWIETATSFLDLHPDAAVACGRRRERHPEASIYNRLCDIEWNTPVGCANACGGDALIRASAFREVGGYRCDVLAAEDDELCLRLRRAGWKIVRLDADMTTHDAAIIRFSQWWRRAQCAGQAYAQGFALHGRSPERHFARDCARIVGWSLLLPATAILFSWWTHGLSLLLFGLYPLLAVRIHRSTRRKGWDGVASAWYALLTVLAKFPALIGLLGFCLRALLGGRRSLIEYKQPARLS